MRNRTRKLMLLVAPALILWGCTLLCLGDDRTPAPATPQTFPAFKLGEVQLTSEPRDSAQDSQKSPALTVVCFLGTQCPLAKLYAVRLNELGSNIFKTGCTFYRRCQ